MDRPGTPPNNGFNRIPFKTVEELDSLRKNKRDLLKTSGILTNSAFHKTKKTIYVATADWCGHCKRLKKHIFLGQDEIENTFDGFCKLINELGESTLYEDDDVCVRILETSNSEKTESIVSFLRESGVWAGSFPAYYAVKNEPEYFFINPPAPPTDDDQKAWQAAAQKAYEDAMEHNSSKEAALEAGQNSLQESKQKAAKKAYLAWLNELKLATNF